VNQRDPLNVPERQGASTARIAQAVLSVAVLLTTTVVHVATYLGFNLTADSEAPSFVLHVAALMVFGLAVNYLRSQMPPSPIPTGVPQWFVENGMPRWAIRLLHVIFVYALLNFVLFLVLTRGLYAKHQNGQYVLASHGHVERVVSEAEYREDRLRHARGLSGHWILFSLFSSLVFTVRRRGDGT